MPEFDFIVDKDLRTSLDSDWRELQDSFDHSAWKAVHVLAGSIVEAILVDHLLSVGYDKKDPLKMVLEEAIAVCRAEGILTEKAVELSTVIRRFRNLIHPGRAVRLQEVPDVNGATVARSLVLIILTEITNAKRQTYGYTAEQIVSKVERDSSAVAILPHLLQKTNAREIGRLLLEILPNRYRALEADSWLEPDSDLSRIEKTFHAAFEAAEPATRKLVAQRFVTILHEADGVVVNTHERVFFRSAQLAYLDLNDIRTITQHLVSELRNSPSKKLFEAATGIGKYLVENEVADFVDATVNVILGTKKESLRGTCESFLSDLYFTLPPGVEAVVTTRLATWADSLDARGRGDDATLVRSLVIDLPF